MNASLLAKVLIGTGVVLVVSGLVVLVFSRLGGERLPGDLTIEVGGLRIHFLLGLSLVLSVVGTLLIALLRR